MGLGAHVLTAAALLASVSGADAPAAAAEGTGGTAAPSAGLTGGSEYGVAAAAAPTHPLLVKLGVPRTVAPGSLPAISLRVEEPGVATVALRVSVIEPATRKAVLSTSLGWAHTRRTIAVRWPAGATLAPGSYAVSVSGHDHRGAALARAARGTAASSFTVTPSPVSPPPVAPPAPAPAASEAGAATPAQTAAAGAVFPVAGAHNFGGPENRYGAPRGTHTHQGQDVLTSEGTPVIAPLAGTITWTSYQPGGAGYYAVEHTAVGLDFMFAHCQAGTVAAHEGQLVSAGQQLCAAGQTGDATTPHLHLEVWVGGWQAPGGQPIDPLPYLEAWERDGSS